MDELWDDDDGWMSDNDDDNNNNDDGDEKGGGNDENEHIIPGAHHILLYIDCLMMNKKNNNNNKQDNDHYNDIDNTMNAIEIMIRSKIRSVTIQKVGKRDGLGIIFYNTKYRKPNTNFIINNEHDNEHDNEQDNINNINKNNNDDDNDNYDGDNQDEDDDNSEDLLWSESRYTLPTTVHEFISLKPPGIKTVKAIQLTLPSSTSTSTLTSDRTIDLIQEYYDDRKHDETATNHIDDNDNNELPTTISLQLALHQSLQIFHQAKCVKPTKNKSNNNDIPDTKQIWILTNQDNPFEQVDNNNNNSMHTQIQATMNDLYENGIEVLVWPIRWSSPNDKWFNYTIFYDHIDVDKPLQIDDDDENDNNDNVNDVDENQKWIQDIMISYIQQGWKKTRRSLCIPLLLPNWNCPSIFTNSDNGVTDDNNHHNDNPRDNNITKVENFKPYHSDSNHSVPLLTKIKQEENIPDSMSSFSNNNIPKIDNNNDNATIQPDHCNSTSSSNIKNDKNESNIIMDDNTNNTKTAIVENHWPSKMGIMVDLYRLIQPCRKPPKVPIHAETGRVLSRVRQWISSGGGEVLAEYKPFAKSSTYKTSSTVSLEERIRRYVVFGGVHVPMTKSDMIHIRQSSNSNKEFASLIIIGFQPKGSIPFFHKLDHSYFVYPTIDIEKDDQTKKKSNASNNKKSNDMTSNTIVGCEAFAHLHASMIRKNVVAIGELLTRVTATSRLVVLWPVGEATSSIQHNISGNSTNANKDNDNNDDDEKRLPPGLGMSSIPFEDEVRTHEDDIAIETYVENGHDIASNELVDAAIGLIEKQTISNIEIGESFINANMQQFWDYVEHIALEEPIDDDENNRHEKYDTIIDPIEVMNVIGDQVQIIRELLPDDDDTKKKKKQQQDRKRKAMVDDTSGLDWKTIYYNDQLYDCKVNDLKMKLRSIGETVSGNKEQLITRLLPHLEAEFLDTKVKKEDGL